MSDLGSEGDELFSMDELEKDLKKKRKAGGGGRRAPWFLAGLLLGIAGTVFLPGLLSPYLPAVFGGNRELLTGPILAEERDGDRLLLTVQAEPGAFIASFTQRVAEIAMLVAPGDTVTLAVDDYDPFIEDPDFEGVRKSSASAVREGGPAGSDAGADTARAAMGGPPDSAGAAGTTDDEAGPGPAEGAEGAAPDSSMAADTTSASAADDGS